MRLLFDFEARFLVLSTSPSTVVYESYKIPKTTGYAFFQEKYQFYGSFQKLVFFTFCSSGKVSTAGVWKKRSFGHLQN